MSHNPEDLTRISQAFLAAEDVAYEWDLTTDEVVWIGDIQAWVHSNSPVVMPTGEALKGRINPQDLPDRLSTIAEHFATHKTVDLEYRLRRADGSFCWVHERGQAEFSESGQPRTYRGILRQVSSRKAYQAKLEHAANFDDLTGHLNRGRLREALEKNLAYAERYSSKGAFLAIGIDKLGLINDGIGHAAADAVIIGVGQRIQRSVRASDTVGRIGGDTFGVIIDNCGDQEMAAVSDKLMTLFRDRPVQTPAGPIHITVSVGGVTFPDMASTASEAFTRSEGALLEAKRKGRDCFMQYFMDDEQRGQQRRHIEIGEQVKQAMKQDNIFFAYQPVVDATTHKPDFYECLLRMRDPEGNLVPAGLFIPTVEKLGLNRLVDLRVLDLCVAELKQNSKIKLAMNISGHTCSDRSWLASLTALVQDDRQVAERLIIEITETAAIRDLDETTKFVHKVRELGCKVALDDFGAGYTSFLHLKTLEVDVVKIDGSFVKGLAKDEKESQVFIQTLMGLTKSFNLTTVAECVETAEQAEILCCENVQLLQGWHFGKPEIERPWKTDAEASDKDAGKQISLVG